MDEKERREYKTEKQREYRDREAVHRKHAELSTLNSMAFQDAVERAERAKRYAEKFPHLIRPSEERYQDVEWQFHNESVKHYPAK